MKVSIVPSGGVDGCWLSARSGADLLNCEPMGDDVQGSASTLGADTVQCKPLLFAEQME